MLELAGAPVINREDYNLHDISELTPTLGEYAGAAAKESLLTSPVANQFNIEVYNNLGQATTETYGDEYGNPYQVRRGIELDDPRSWKVPLDVANERGKDIGLRFSEEPTEAQFDYLAQIKQSENARSEILSHSPTFSPRGAIGMVAGLAGGAVDPVNIAVSFVPVVGEARYLRMIERIGAQAARLSKGAIEGAAGMAALTPLLAAQNNALSRDYGMSQAFQDIVFGGALGAGLHWAGGLLHDTATGKLRADVADLIRKAAPDERWAETVRSGADRRDVHVQEGENAARHDALTPDERSKVLNAAVKAVERDLEPKVDELLKTDARLADMAIPDKRFRATINMRSDFAAEDFTPGAGGAAASIMEMSLSRLAKGEASPQAFRTLFDTFAGRYKKLGQEFKIENVTPAEFQQRAATALETPNQRAVIEPATRTILTTEGATLGAVHHEIQRALDDTYGLTGGERGGYRYNRKEIDRMNAHRAAMQEIAEATPNRAPPRSTPQEAVDLFSTDNKPIMGARGQEASDRAWDRVEQDKDRDLDTMIKDEEVGVIEDIAHNITGAAKDLGIMDKVIPLEERQILAEAAAKAGKQDLGMDLFKAADKAAEKGVEGGSISDAELLLRAGPDKLAELIKGEKTTEDVIAETEAEGTLVTRVNAAKDVRFYLSRIKQELHGEPLERAIRAVQDGENVNVAVDAVLRDQVSQEPGAGTAEKPAAAPAPEDDIKARIAELEKTVPTDMVEDAKAIFKELGIDDKRDLAEPEARLVAEEHAALEDNAKTRDLFSQVEQDEFNAANRERALRQGDPIGTGGQGGGAGVGRPGPVDTASLQTAALGRDGEAVRGAGPAAEREGAAAGGERSAPTTAISYGAWNVPRRVVTPDGSIELSVEPRIVELDSLIHAEGALQVRDRSRKESIIEARERALKLDPEQLLPNRVADAGSPIVYSRPDGTYTIISGNGRTLSLRQVYGDDTLVGKAQQYRERLGPAADGYRRPVLVNVISDTLSEAELAKFGERANRSRIAEMSATEKAQRDADAAGIEVMGLYQGGDFTKRENQAFVRAFMMRVVTAQERGDMSKNGVLTKTGVDRLNGAVLAAAYDDASVLSLMLESTDLNIKSIASAYRDVAPAFMRLRAEIAQGLVREEMDITPYMMEAARFVQKAREEGVKIGSALSQIDALSPMDPVVDRLIRQFYNPQLTRANSSLRIAENLRLYAEAAREKRTGGFIEDTTTPLDVIDVSERQLARNADETLLAVDDENAGGGDEGAGGEVPQPAPQEPGPVAGERGAGGSSEAAARPAAEAGAPAAVADPLGLRPQLAGMKLAELRDYAKENGLKAKARTKDALIDAIIKETTPAAASRLPEPTAPKSMEARPTRRQEPSLEQNIRTAAWAEARDYLDNVRDVVSRRAGEFQGRAKTIVERLGKNAAEVDEHVKAGRFDDAQELLGDMVDDAARLREIDPRQVSNLVTQDVRMAARKRGLNPDGSSTATAKLIDRKDVGETDEFSFHQFQIEVGGNKWGSAAVSYNKISKQIQVDNIVKGPDPTRDADRVPEGKNQLGSSVIRNLTTDLRREFPQAESISGIRISGARKQAGVPIDKLTSIEFKPEQAPALGQEQRTAFYDFLEGKDAIRGAGTIAKKLKVTEETAYRLLDDAEKNGWIKVKDDGSYIRVRKDLRPDRPDVISNEQAPRGWGSIGGDDTRSEIKDLRDQMASIFSRIEILRKQINDTLSSPIGDKRTYAEREAQAKPLGEEINRLSKEHTSIYEKVLRLEQELRANDNVLATTRGDAMEFLRQKFPDVNFREEYGYINLDDYVDLAIGHGFQPSKEYLHIRGMRDNVNLEAQLQSHLAIQRVIGEAAHRLPEAVRVLIEDSDKFRGQSQWYKKAANGFNAVRVLISSHMGKESVDLIRNTVNHETFHALRASGLFTAWEWAAVRAEAVKARFDFWSKMGDNPSRLERYRARYEQRLELFDLHPSRDEAYITDQMVEEWAATDHGFWAKDRAKERESFMGRLHQRIDDFFKDLDAGFTRLIKRAVGMEDNRPTLEQLYRSIEDGTVANRFKEWGLDKVGADNPLSVSRQAGDEFSAMLNRGMREIAKDENIAEGQAVEEALKNLAPCASYHL